MADLFQPDWQPAPTSPGLPDADELSLWQLSLNGLPDSFFQNLEIFSEAEQARARQLVHPQRRRQFVAGRRMLRQLAGAVLGIPPGQVRLILSGSGKPGLDPQMHSYPLQFSLSHTSDWLMIATTAGQAAGVDLEPVTRRPNLEALAERFFSKDEVEQLSRASEAFKPECFFRLWTAKESAVKAWGGGISSGFDRFTVHLADTGPATLSHPFGPDVPGCQLGHFQPHSGLMAAWAVAGKVKNVRYWNLASWLA